MRLPRPASIALCGAALTAVAPAAVAQLREANAAGVRTGHMHLTVPDVERHREIWRSLGAETVSAGSLELLRLPGIYIALTAGEPAVPSTDTFANHLAFSVADYDAYRDTLEAVGADLAFDDAAGGQILADLPDGVRVEIVVDEEQQAPIEFDHVHLVASDPEALSQWYAELLGGEPGRRGNSSAVTVPGGRVEVLMRGGDRLPTRGSALDHIGFEVTDMEAFAARVERMGVAFDVPPRTIEALGLTIAFLTDPVGTYIEITQGLPD